MLVSPVPGVSDPSQLLFRQHLHNSLRIRENRIKSESSVRPKEVDGKQRKTKAIMHVTHSTRMSSFVKFSPGIVPLRIIQCTKVHHTPQDATTAKGSCHHRHFNLPMKKYSGDFLSEAKSAITPPNRSQRPKAMTASPASWNINTPVKTSLTTGWRASNKSHWHLMLF